MINSEVKSSLILGVVDICLLKYGTNDRCYLEVFFPIIPKPTRVTHTSGILIDLIYSNLTCKDTLNRLTNKPTFILKRKFTETNMTKFKQLLCDRDCSETLNTDCPDYG